MPSPKSEQDSIKSELEKELEEARKIMDLKAEIGKLRQYDRELIAVLAKIKQITEITKEKVEDNSAVMADLITVLEMDGGCSLYDEVADHLIDTSNDKDVDDSKSEPYFFEEEKPRGLDGVCEITKLTKLASHLIEEQYQSRKKIAAIAALNDPR